MLLKIQYLRSLLSDSRQKIFRVPPYPSRHNRAADTLPTMVNNGEEALILVEGRNARLCPGSPEYLVHRLILFTFLTSWVVGAAFPLILLVLLMFFDVQYFCIAALVMCIFYLPVTCSEGSRAFWIKYGFPPTKIWRERIPISPTVGRGKGDCNQFSGRETEGRAARKRITACWSPIHPVSSGTSISSLDSQESMERPMESTNHPTACGSPLKDLSATRCTSRRPGAAVAACSPSPTPSIADYNGQPQLFSVHPHGIFCLGFARLALSPLCANGQVTFCFSSVLQNLPFVNMVLRSALSTYSTVDGKAMKSLMNKKKSLAILPGGFEEATITSHCRERLYLKSRQGFVAYVQYLCAEHSPNRRLDMAFRLLPDAQLNRILHHPHVSIRLRQLCLALRLCYQALLFFRRIPAVSQPSGTLVTPYFFEPIWYPSCFTMWITTVPLASEGIAGRKCGCGGSYMLRARRKQAGHRGGCGSLSPALHRRSAGPLRSAQGKQVLF